MEWTMWRPSDEQLSSIKELLQDALVPNSEIQKDVQTKLKNLQNVEDFTYYLLYIVGQSDFSDEIRSLGGVLLKNNLAIVYHRLPHDSIIKIRQLCLALLQDPVRDVRTSMANVIYTLAKDNVNKWPELIPFLMALLGSSDEFTEVALATLFSVCEEMVQLGRTDEEICQVTKEVFPKFIECLAIENFTRKKDVIKLINDFMHAHYRLMKQSIDFNQYLTNIMQLAATTDFDLQVYICEVFTMYFEYREESLVPHLHNVIIYLLLKTQYKDWEIALTACEFWLAVTKASNCKDILTPYVDQLVPVLLKNMKYSDFELVAIKDTIQDEDPMKDVYPFQLHGKKSGRLDIFSSGDDEDDTIGGSCDDVDDFYVGWTLRKCSAASLDALAVKFGEDTLAVVVPYLNELLHDQDFLTKESAILALGAISEGCASGLVPYLPELVNYLVNAMNDEHSMVRVIACWTLSRYANWIVVSQLSDGAYFLPVMTTLLKHFMDDSRRVQKAAISAFCVFEEEAQRLLIPYIDLILEGFQQGFQKFNSRSLYLLYDAITVLVMSVGNEIAKPEFVDKLLPPLLQKLNECSYVDDQFMAIMECLSTIIQAFSTALLPYAEALYSLCMEVIMDTMRKDANFQQNLNDFEPPDKEPMHISLDVLYSMAIGLKTYFGKFVANSNLICILYSTMQDESLLIRQTSTGMYGELVQICYPHLCANAKDYIKVILKNVDEKYACLCRSAAWVIGHLARAMGVEIAPFVPEIVPIFVNLLKNQSLYSGIHQALATSLCILACVCPDVTITDSEEVLKTCCLTMRNMRDCEEKYLAFRGLCQLVMLHFEFCQNNFLYFLDAVGSWSKLKPDLRDMIKAIVDAFRHQCSEMQWLQLQSQLAEPLKQQLVNLYGV